MMYSSLGLTNISYAAAFVYLSASKAYCCTAIIVGVPLYEYESCSFLFVSVLRFLA